MVRPLVPGVGLQVAAGVVQFGARVELVLVDVEATIGWLTSM